MAVSPSMVSGRVVATTILSSECLSILLPDHCKRTRAFDLICKGCDHSEFKPFLHVIALDIHQGPSLDLLLVDLDVRKAGVEVYAPIDEAVGTVDQTFLVQ